MNLLSLCRRPVVAIDENASVIDAARRMREHHVGALVVTTQGPQGTWVSGIVTDRDLVIEGLAVPARGVDVAVGVLAARSLVSVRDDGTVADAIAAMAGSGVRRLLVVDAQGHLSGIVSIDDLLAALARDAAGLSEALRVGAQHEANAAEPMPPKPTGLRVPAMGTAGWQPAMG